MPKPKLKDLKKRSEKSEVRSETACPPAEPAPAYERVYVSFEIPLAPPVPESNIPRTLNTGSVYLRPAEGELLKRLTAGLDAANERIAAGRHVGPHHGRAVQWLLERLAESLEEVRSEK